MATSGGFGGGPALPMGDNLAMSAVVLVLVIVALIYIVTRVFEF